MVWEFTDLVVVLAWLGFLMGGMGKRDRMWWVPCKVPVIATTLEGGIELCSWLSLLIQLPGLITYLWFSVSHVCHTHSYLSLLLWPSRVSSDLSRIIVYWTLLEWYESFLGVHWYFCSTPLYGHVYILDAEWVSSYVTYPAILYLCIWLRYVISTLNSWKQCTYKLFNKKRIKW